MFFPQGVPCALLCAQGLAAEALALGGKEVVILHDGSWWAVGSATDWFLRTMTIQEQFATIIPLPEVAPNASRVEVVVASYSSDVSVLSEGELQVLSGVRPASHILDVLVARRMARSVVFRFDSQARESSSGSEGR